MGAIFSYVSVNIPPLKKKQTQQLQKEMMISPGRLLLEGEVTLNIHSHWQYLLFGTREKEGGIKRIFSRDTNRSKNTEWTGKWAVLSLPHIMGSMAMVGKENISNGHSNSSLPEGKPERLSLSPSSLPPHSDELFNIYF